MASAWERPLLGGGHTKTDMRSRAHSFQFAARFLPPAIQRDVAIVYAYYRTIDDLVDEPGERSEAQILAELAAWKDRVEGKVPAVGLAARLLDVTDRYQIPPGHLTMVVEGARLDLRRRWVETRSELLDYSVLVAGSVGMVMARILGASGADALSLGKELGVGMQLTNVVRDVGEDLERGRLYLPRQDLLAAGFHGAPPLTVETLAQQWPSVRRVVQDISREARECYRRGMQGIVLLHPSCRFSIRLAAELYARILTKVDEAEVEALSRRSHVDRLEKLQTFFSLCPAWAGSSLHGSRFGRAWRMFQEPVR